MFIKIGLLVVFFAITIAIGLYCRKHYGSEQMVLFEGEHYLNGVVLGKVIIPLVEKLLGI